MYLGPLERSYNLVLRSFSDRMSDPSVQVSKVVARRLSSDAGTGSHCSHRRGSH